MLFDFFLFVIVAEPIEGKVTKSPSVLILYYCFPLSVATSWDDLRRFCRYGSDIDVNIRKVRKIHKSNFKLIIIIFLNSNLIYECDTLLRCAGDPSLNVNLYR